MTDNQIEPILTQNATKKSANVTQGEIEDMDEILDWNSFFATESESLQNGETWIYQTLEHASIYEDHEVPPSEVWRIQDENIEENLISDDTSSKHIHMAGDNSPAIDHEFLEINCNFLIGSLLT